MIKQITVEELKQWQNENKSFQLIDVREPHEKEIADIGGELIPLGTVPYELDKINKDTTIVVYCRSGKRSGEAVNFIETKLGLQEVYNLEGGILAWADKIDQNITKY
jgi:sulfur-carrier protein adenylyltransferase/sulfurtransferase